jgi:hypothetical protein
MIRDIVKSWFRSDLEEAEQAIIERYNEIREQESKNTTEMTFQDGRLTGLHDAIREIDKVRQNE